MFKEWTDDNLRWNESEYGDIKDLRIPPRLYLGPRYPDVQQVKILNHFSHFLHRGTNKNCKRPLETSGNNLTLNFYKSLRSLFCPLTRYFARIRKISSLRKDGSVCIVWCISMLYV